MKEWRQGKSRPSERREAVKPTNKTPLSVALALAALAIAAPPAGAERPMVTQATLLDRIQIEDMIVGYYYHLGSGDHKGFSEYYVEDAEFDVNGKVYKGQAAIEGVYARMGRERSPLAKNVFHMLLNNPMITITGDTATARFIWTGVITDNVKAPPRLQEQGREYDLLVKRGGQWMIKRRTIISDAALSDEFDPIYQPRMDYDPATGK
jgi:ketosteroid isomerase-like protein